MKENNKFVEIIFEIKSYDIDAAGHVNNAVYLNWLEDLRVKLFRDIFQLDFLVRNNIHLVVASTNIKYKAPLFLFNRPRGIMEVDQYSRGVWYLSAKFKRGNSITTEAFQKCVFIDNNNNRRMVKNIIVNSESE